MSTIVLHIGAGKCGSSAIQAFLNINRSTLRQNGVFVPSSQLTPDQSVESGAPVWFFQNLLRLERAEAQATLQRNLDNILDIVPSRERARIVISAENLSASQEFPSILEILKRRCEMRIVFYVRRQDDFLLSAWRQWFLKENQSFNEWVKSEQAGKLADWSRILQSWELIFGRENIVVRRFVRSHFVKEDIARDFVFAADLPWLDYYFPPMETNRSYDESIGYLAHAARDLFTDIHDGRFFKMFEEVAGAASFSSQKGSSLMTLEQRCDLLRAYGVGNDRLKKTYFDDDDEPLFLRPTQDVVIGKSSDEVLQSEIGMLARVLFGMYQEIVGSRQEAIRLRREIRELRETQENTWLRRIERRLFGGGRSTSE